MDNEHSTRLKWMITLLPLLDDNKRSQVVSLSFIGSAYEIEATIGRINLHREEGGIE